MKKSELVQLIKEVIIQLSENENNQSRFELIGDYVDDILLALNKLKKSNLEYLVRTIDKTGHAFGSKFGIFVELVIVDQNRISILIKQINDYLDKVFIEYDYNLNIATIYDKKNIGAVNNFLIHKNVELYPNNNSNVVIIGPVASKEIRRINDILHNLNVTIVKTS